MLEKMRPGRELTKLQQEKGSKEPRFYLITHGWDILMPGTHCEARSFIGVYNQTHSRYK